MNHENVQRLHRGEGLAVARRPRRTKPPRPSVDFNRDLVLLAAQGNHATGGYDILLDSAGEAGGGITFNVTGTSPGPGCIVTRMLTQPVDIARLSRVDPPVTFVVTPHTTVCAP